MLRLFTHLSADYSLRHLVNNVVIHIYTHDYIRRIDTVKITALSNHIPAILNNYSRIGYSFAFAATNIPFSDIAVNTFLEKKKNTFQA
jgi:hypothetical protein